MNQNRGIIYILINSSFLHLVKIGKTQRTSEIRAKELYQGHSGVPNEFVVAYEWEVSDCHLLEKVIHEKFAPKRNSVNREFFAIPLKDAIKKVDAIIKELEGKHQLELNSQLKPASTGISWWEGLGFCWQQVFRLHLNLTYAEPNEIDILEAIHSIIDYAPRGDLREIVMKRVKEASFKNNLLVFYKRLGFQKEEFNSYLAYDPTNEEIQKCFTLRELDCFNNGGIFHLPLQQFTMLEKLDCKNTKVFDLSTLNKCLNLREIVLNHTNVTSLDALEHLPNLRTIHCGATYISDEEIIKFKGKRPDCQVEKAEKKNLLL